MALLGLIRGNLMECQKSNSAPTFVDHYVLPDINFNGHCLITNDFALNNCLFGSEKLTENVDPHKFKYSGYGIRLDSRSEFLFRDGSKGKMSLFLGLIWAHLCTLIIKIKIY